MTREEAIEKLTGIRDEAKEGVCYVTECDVEALDMAINSLKVDEQYQLEYEEIEPCKTESINENKYKADMREPKGEKRRCNTCKNREDDEISGECYECIKGIFDHYEAESEE